MALTHVKALDPKAPGNQGYILSSLGLEGTKWEDVFEIIKRKFPDEVAKGVLPNNGSIVSGPIKIDEKRSEEIFGMKYRGFEEQVEDVVKFYLSLLA